MKRNKNESGRSMVEMLGVLAIIGVLSVGGIAEYDVAINKIQLNKTAELLNRMMLALDVAADSEDDIFETYFSAGNKFNGTQTEAYFDQLCSAYIGKEFCGKYTSSYFGSQEWNGLFWGTRNINDHLVEMHFVATPKFCNQVLQYIRDNEASFKGYYAGFSWSLHKAWVIYSPEDPADGNSKYAQTGSLFKKTNAQINSFCSSSTNKWDDKTGFQLFFYK